MKLWLILFLSSLSTHAQNFFPNPGFEDLNTCTEYRVECAPEAWFYIKPTTNPLVNGRGIPRPLLGNNLLLVPVHNVFTPDLIRPYVYTMFTCPLIIGEKYKLTFYLNTARRKFYKLDFHLSEMEPANIKFRTDTLTPTFSLEPANIVLEMKQGWQAVEYEFTATNNAGYCVIGNMSGLMPYKVIDVMNRAGAVYYFLDEIKLTSVSNNKICDTYDERLRLMYAQNLRHTEYVVIKDEPVNPPPPTFYLDTINIPAIFFENNSAVLKPQFKSRIDSISNGFISRRVRKIDIVGHTDSNGEKDKNLILSLARAQSFKNYFLSRFPQFVDIVSSSGRGQEQPIAPNTTSDGRAKNRRVEIILTIRTTDK